MEALACGRPGVTMPVHGIPEWICPGVNGLRIPSDDANALPNAIASLIQNSELYDRLRMHARAFVESAFDLKSTTAQLSRLLHGQGDCTAVSPPPPTLLQQCATDWTSGRA